MYKSWMSHNTSSFSSRWQKVVLVTVLVLVAWLGFSLGFHRVLVVGRGYRFDFSYRWVAGRAAFDGMEPYSQEVSRAIYRTMFGAEPPSDGYVQGFSNPAYHLLLFIPFYFLPFEVAVSLWAGLQLVFLFASVMLGLYLLNDGQFPSPAVLVGIVLYCTWYRYTMIGLTFAQFIIFQLLITVLFVLAVVHRRDWWAGIGLALATNHPALSLVMVVAGLGQAILTRRWKIVAGFALGILALMIGSIVWLGWWVPDFLESTLNYSHRVPWLLANRVIGLRATVLVTTLLVGGVAFAALRRPNPEFKRAGLALTAGIGLYLVPQTNSYNLTLLLIVVLLGWRSLRNPWLRAAWLAGWWLLPWINWGTNDLTLTANLWVIYGTTLIWGILLAFKLWPHWLVKISEIK
jgi:hypothetical protein